MPVFLVFGSSLLLWGSHGETQSSEDRGGAKQGVSEGSSFRKPGFREAVIIECRARWPPSFPEPHFSRDPPGVLTNCHKLTILMSTFSRKYDNYKDRIIFLSSCF